MTPSTIPETAGERALSALMLVLLLGAAACLVWGLTLWLAHATGPAASFLLAAGLIGLLAIPIVKLVAVVVAASVDRDWVTLGATLAVMAILFALTLRDALTAGDRGGG